MVFVRSHVQKWLQQPGCAGDLSAVAAELLPSRLRGGEWVEGGGDAPGRFRINDLKLIPSIDDLNTIFLNESQQLFVDISGESVGASAHLRGIIQVTDLVETFAVTNSLNEFYYGQPLQFWASNTGGIEPLLEANPEAFAPGRINSQGICFDPEWLIKLFKPAGEDPFRPVGDLTSAPRNYGSMFFSRSGDSLCKGPIYCSTPVVVDSHTFWGPVLTAGLFYRRTGAQPKVQLENSTFALVSSKRVQMALESLEGDLPREVQADRDSYPRVAPIPGWRPDFGLLRDYARHHGLYIDKAGVGYLRGEKVDIDYHLRQQDLRSESYTTPVLPGRQFDRLTEAFVTLATRKRFGDRNNLDADALKGARVLFSENSVFLRGQVGDDLVIATPRHILLTGSVNEELVDRQLFLIAGEGVGVATHDLQAFIGAQNPDAEMMKQVRNWVVRAIIYKPGAGWFCDWQKSHDDPADFSPQDQVPGQKVAIQIVGACLEGNLNRWVNCAAMEGIRVFWKPRALSRLPVNPRTASVFRLKSVPMEKKDG